MAYDSKSLDDYVDVAERIAAFYERYPDGSLQPADPKHPFEIVFPQGLDKDGKPVTATFIAYTAMAYRTPDDTRPGVGVAWEIVPGRTPYTRGSELMNAETSAWGRAIVALGIAAKKGVASRQEVEQARNRQDGLPANRDGSISRSRVTDEQLDAAGVMTRPQAAGHNALQPKRADQTAAVQRAATSDPDWDQHLDDPEDRPGSSTPDQHRAMGTAFTQAGVKTRPERMRLTSEQVGRPVESGKELSFTEAAGLLLHLAKLTPEGAKT